MLRTKVIIALCFVGSIFILATRPEPLPKKYGEKISAADLKEYLSILASDAMEGRETGKRGQKMAAAFIRAHFEDLGLTGPIAGNYYQPMEFYTTEPGETYLVSGSNRFVNFEHVIYSGGDTQGESTIPLVFAGYGAQTDLDIIDVKNKAVLLLSSPGNRSVVLARERGAKLVLVCNTRTKEAFDELVSRTLSIQRDQGLSTAKPVLNEFPRPGLFYVSPEIVQKLIGELLTFIRSGGLTSC